MTQDETHSNKEQDTAKSHRKVLVVTLSVIAFMFGVSFASVPLYNLFCSVTGYGGTTKKAEDIASNNMTPIDRLITVRFNADVDKKLPWSFEPSQLSMQVKVGEPALAYYKIKNNSDEKITGMAVYNVAPNKAGEYFVKQYCFCFDSQVVDPNEEQELPVSFFIDPEIADDSNLDEVKTITLSYTFFKKLEG